MFAFDDNINGGDGSIFHQLLSNYSNDPCAKQAIDGGKHDHIDFGEELNIIPSHKSSGEWVWADEEFRE